MKPILDTKKGHCFICGRWGITEKHHIFGAANRRWSEEFGLYVFLCHSCHNEPPNGVHFSPRVRKRLQGIGQKAFEEKYSHEEFMRIFGRNYKE